jgi:hypothetical protein
VSNWRVRLVVTEHRLEATHPRTTDRFFELEADDELGAVNQALAAVFAQATEHRSSITAISADRPLEMP